MPQLVFVTAYDEYAARAFEAQAIDYVLKPVQPERLRKTVARLQQALAARAASPRAPAGRRSAGQTLAQWRQLLAAAGGGGALPEPHAAPLQADCRQRCRRQHRAHGADRRGAVLRGRRQVPARAHRQHEYLIRTPLKQLLPQLDAHAFWQVHRAVVVRSAPSNRCTATRPASCTLAARPGARRSRSAGSTPTCFAPCEKRAAHEKSRPLGAGFFIAVTNRCRA